ncbi:hypothetical protein C8T65DRAFT_582309 [Cerioporus squamosus]|nr:hypothetical protein C8T65DRAFT_582309 [Cerioporus squamosus]
MLSLTAVLFFWDCFGVTFDREVASFWTAKWSGASLLFFANKWIFFADQVTGFINLASFPSDKVSSLSSNHVRSCSLFVLASYPLTLLQLVPGAVFSALRVYVLSRSKLLGSLVLILSLAPVGANMVHYGYQLSGERFPPFGCAETIDMSLTVSIRFVALISRVPLIVADMLIVYITWSKLSSRIALRDIRQHKRLSLSDILLRDGMSHFQRVRNSRGL